MSVTSKNVYNLNNLSGTNFIFKLDKYPNLNFTIQDVNLPGVIGNMKEIPIPTGSYKIGYDKLNYEKLKIQFIVDESLNNWREVYNWMRAIATTHVLDTDYNKYSEKIQNDGSLYTTAILNVLTNSLSNEIKFTFYNLFPDMLTGVDFSTRDQDDIKRYSIVTFNYDYYDIEVVGDNSEEYVGNNKIV